LWLAGPASQGRASVVQSLRSETSMSRRQKLTMIFLKRVCGGVAYGATIFFERFVVVSGCGVAGQEDKSLCPRDRCAFPPRHQTTGLQFFMGDEFHISSLCGSSTELK
jgi:hypothetical protein